MEFRPETWPSLKHYVYLYRDPDTGFVFYVGRGQGNRAFDHLKDESETRKVEVISRLAAAGKSPVIDILRSGMSEDQAKLVEAAVMDLLGLNQLTNSARGNHDGTMGRVSARTIIGSVEANPVEIVHRSILIRINRLYREDMTETELYEVTRGIWKVGPRCQTADYAMAVYRGVVKEVYRIRSWHPAKSTPYTTRTPGPAAGRKEFDGEVAPQEVRAIYIGKSVRDYFKKGMQRPIVYVNV